MQQSAVLTHSTTNERFALYTQVFYYLYVYNSVYIIYLSIHTLEMCGALCGAFSVYSSERPSLSARTRARSSVLYNTFLASSLWPSPAVVVVVVSSTHTNTRASARNAGVTVLANNNTRLCAPQAAQCLNQSHFLDDHAHIPRSILVYTYTNKTRTYSVAYTFHVIIYHNDMIEFWSHAHILIRIE